MLRICSDPEEAARHFVITDCSEIAANEFNLNVSRYVETCEPDELLALPRVLEEVRRDFDNIFHLEKDLLLSLKSVAKATSKKEVTHADSQK